MEDNHSIEKQPERRAPIFIGSLNIMSAPARGLFTRPLTNWYRSRYHNKYTRPQHRFAFDLALIGVGVALAAAAIYFGILYKPYDPITHSLIITPNQLIAGGEAVARLRIENNSAYNLDDVTVVLNLPPNIIVTQVSLPFDEKEKQIHYNTILPGETVEARLTGTITGAVGTNHRASAIISYTERETGRHAKKVTVTSIAIARGPVSAAFELPARIIAGAEIEGHIRYRNRSNNATGGAVITPTWPEGFLLTSSTPAVRNGRWVIGTLAPGTEDRIVFTGVLRPPTPTSDTVTFTATVGVQDGNNTLNQGQTETEVKLIDPEITLEITTTKPAARIGEMVPLTITYKNNGSLTGTNARLVLTDDAERNIKTIGAFNPGVAGSASATTTIKNFEAQTKAPVATATALLRFEVDEPEHQTVSIVMPVHIKIATTLGLSSSARYWSQNGDQLGRGPLPPIVNQPTKYWVFWNIQNTLSGVTGSRVTGVLPPNVSWTGKASIPYGDPLRLDPDTRTLTWNVGDVPVRPGSDTPAIGAAFEVSIIPTPDQIGTSPALITNQKVSGTDSFTNLVVNGDAPTITTTLSSDPRAAGKNKVQ